MGEEEADICYERCLSELPRIGKKRFTGLVVTTAAAEVISSTSRKIEDHIDRARFSRRLCCFKLQKPAENLRPYQHHHIFPDSLKRLVGESRRVDQWVKDYNIGSLELYTAYRGSDGRIWLELEVYKPRIEEPRISWILTVGAYVVGNGHEAAMSAADLLGIVGLLDLENRQRGRRGKTRPGSWAKPLAGEDAIDIFYYAVLAVSEEHSELGPLAEIAARAAAIARTALPEMRRAGKIRLKYSSLPPVEEAVGVAREVARAAYGVAIEALKQGDTGLVKRLLNEKRREGEVINIGRALGAFLMWEFTSWDMALAKHRLKRKLMRSVMRSAFMRSAWLRVIEEILTSLLDP